MENFHVDFSAGENITIGRKRFYIIFGTALVLLGLLGLITELNERDSKPIQIFSPIIILLNGIVFLFQIQVRKLKFLKCYVAISDELIDFKLWEFGKKRQIEWSEIDTISISDSKISFHKKDKSEITLSLNLISQKTGKMIAESVNGFAKIKGVSC